MDLGDQPLACAEFLAVDVETNGRPGEETELTEIGAVLVGGGELHDRFSSLVAVRAPLSRGIERFTGITQAMVDVADAPELVLPEFAARLEGRVFVAHSASFDRRVLREAFRRADLEWPDPPVLCTVALARRFAPLVRQRKLVALADSLGIDVTESHRALPDAETCARIFCALFHRLCAHAETISDALSLFARRPRRGRRRDARAPLPGEPRAPGARIDWSLLPDAPGVYLFRDPTGRPLYVGKSVSLRSRASSHFRPGAERPPWTEHAVTVDHRRTGSELGALVLENRLIKELRPPGNVALRGGDRQVYLRCRFDVAFPILEVAREPAGGHAVNVGPLRGRAAASELVEQLNSLFGLRHCGRRLPRREHPSAYGQMGRCVSPCLGDLDPNAYRRRLDDALVLFTGDDDARGRLLARITGEMEAEAAAQRFERAAALRRRRARVEVLLQRLDGVLRATHVRPRLVLAGVDHAPEVDAFWIVDGRVADWGPVPGAEELEQRTQAAVRGRADGALSAWVAPDQIDEVRIVAGWLAGNRAPTLDLDPRPSPERLEAFLLEVVGNGVHRAQGVPGAEGQGDRPQDGRQRGEAAAHGLTRKGEAQAGRGDGRGCGGGARRSALPMAWDAGYNGHAPRPDHAESNL